MKGLHEPQEGVKIPVTDDIGLVHPFDGSRFAPTPPFYRFYWRIFYRNGDHRVQYEIYHDKLFQSFFAKIDRAGAQHLFVCDIFKHPDNPILRIDVPEGMLADVLYNCCATLDGKAETHRIYSFGWHTPEGISNFDSEYWHIHPGFDPPRIMQSKKRIIDWSQAPKAQGSSY